ncbi:pleckstrin homology domain-containing family J member 1-like [Bacillus rossius redtenbacheri]|uniref:pleckstrin homology domain-containing family J member 1-like n=1 Tax=Bacillus rossius redtenbacheri TaxID=93214 RepID=UPI002FDE9B08
MRINDKELSQLNLSVTDMEGLLNHRKPPSGNFSQNVFKERLFKLKANLLFYFRVSDIGQIDDRCPAGVLVLENSNIQYEVSTGAPFAFSITFRDEPERKHVFCGRSEAYVQQWVAAVKQASYEHWRSQLILLQSKISRRTGKDPLLMYPHNQGLVRDLQPGAPSSPSAARRLKAVGRQASSFQSHLQTTIASLAGRPVPEADLIQF